MGAWDTKKYDKWVDPYDYSMPMSEIFNQVTVKNLPSLEENRRKFGGCEKCNYETFFRDHDGTWLEDCECVK
jgi:hypothetical protein